MPDGVKVGSVSVSPRGDLRLPSEIEFEDFI
jgi:NAD+ synthase (glutamine-hydrolysing)